MNLETANRWFAVVANIGVIVGIIFLAYELRQNTIATDLEVASNFQNSFTEIEMLIAGDPEFSALLIKGRTDAELSEHEKFRLTVFYGNVLRHWQNVYYQYYSDALDEDIWLGQREYFTLVLSQDKGLVNHWTVSQSHFSPRFNAVMQSMIPKRSAGNESDAKQ